MPFEVKYFYKNGKEMKRGDHVYLKGGDMEGLELSGIFELIGISEDTLIVYLLGQDKEPYQSFDIWIDTISVLVPIEGDELNKTIEEIKKGVFDEIKNRE